MIKNKLGLSLFIGLIFSVITIVVVTTVAKTAKTLQKTTRNIEHLNLAKYNAEGGLEEALMLNRKMQRGELGKAQAGFHCEDGEIIGITDTEWTALDTTAKTNFANMGISNFTDLQDQCKEKGNTDFANLAYDWDIKGRVNPDDKTVSSKLLEGEILAGTKPVTIKLPDELSNDALDEISIEFFLDDNSFSTNTETGSSETLTGVGFYWQAEGKNGGEIQTYAANSPNYNWNQSCKDDTYEIALNTNTTTTVITDPKFDAMSKKFTAIQERHTNEQCGIIPDTNDEYYPHNCKTEIENFQENYYNNLGSVTPNTVNAIVTHSNGTPSYAHTKKFLEAYYQEKKHEDLIIVDLIKTGAFDTNGKIKSSFNYNLSGLGFNFIDQDSKYRQPITEYYDYTEVLNNIKAKIDAQIPAISTIITQPKDEKPYLTKSACRGFLQELVTDDDVNSFDIKFKNTLGTLKSGTTSPATLAGFLKDKTNRKITFNLMNNVNFYKDGKKYSLNKMNYKIDFGILEVDELNPGASTVIAPYSVITVKGRSGGITTKMQVKIDNTDENAMLDYGIIFGD